MTEKLFVYGPLGIFCAILIVAIIYIYRALDAERKAKDALVEALNAKHQAEMATFQERYITKAETWMKQYYDMADAHDETQRATREMFEQFQKYMQGSGPGGFGRRNPGAGG